MNRLLTLMVVSAILTAGCTDTQPQQATIIKTKKESVKDLLLQENQYIIEDEHLQIDELIARYDWDTKRSGTGLRYMIYKNGKGKQAEIGKTVTVQIEIRLINGQAIDIENNEIEFKIHRSENINGLEEGVLKMREGDRAKLVIPSYLAYGLSGYDDKIPMRSTLIIDAELISVRN